MDKISYSYFTEQHLRIFLSTYNLPGACDICLACTERLFFCLCIRFASILATRHFLQLLLYLINYTYYMSKNSQMNHILLMQSVLYVH